MLILYIPLVVVVFILYLYRNSRSLSHIPGPKQSLLLGNASEIKSLDDYPKALLRWSNEHGSFFQYRILWNPQISIGSYRIFKQVLLELDSGENAKFHRRYDGYDAYYNLFGKTVVNTGGSEWKWRRTLLQSVFHPNKMSLLPNIIAKSVQESISKLEEFEGQEVEIHSEMFRITGRVIFRLLFGHDLDYSEFGGIENIKSLFLSMFHFLIAYLSFPIIQYMPFLPIYKKAFAAKEILMRMCRKAISAAIKDIEEGKEGEGLIYDILKKSEGKWTLDELAAEINHIIFAGFDTTTNTLAFMIGVLSRQPELQDRLCEEALRAIPESGEINSTILSKLQLCSSTFLETLRLYPPVAGTSLFAAQDVVLEGYKIPKGTSLGTNFIALARDQEVFPEPEEFKPERFMQGEESSTTPVLGFSLGGHQCLGRRIALLEGKIVPALLFKKFRFSSLPGTKLEMTMENALIEPKGGVKVVVNSRK